MDDSNSAAPASEQKDTQPNAAQIASSEKDDSGTTEKQIERVDEEGNLVYDDEEEEPELSLRTYLALFSMLLMNLVQLVSLIGPPVALSWMGEELHGAQAQIWVPNSISLVQAVLGPTIAFASDIFQARKTLLVGASIISVIGAAIAPGSKDIYRLIMAQTLIGVGFATVPLNYCVPSEIVPRRWRPMVQAVEMAASCLGAIIAPLCIGALTRHDPLNGWRKFYWVQVALWGAIAVGIFVGYRPPKRHTRLDHLSFWQKLGHLDLPGFGLLTTGMSLFLSGLILGGNQYSWTNARVLSTIVIGIAVLIGFGLYEWKGTATGILLHDLFKGGKAQGRTFAICVFLIFLEGILIFTYNIFYPVLTQNLFETDPFLLAARETTFWISGMIGTLIYGWFGTRFRTIREPMFVGFLFFTAGIVGLATIEPGQSFKSLAMCAISGFGFGAPLMLVVAGVQLSTPQSLIATATAVTTSARSLASTTFTAIYTTALNNRLNVKLPNYVGKAATLAGLPAASLPAFIAALSAGNSTALQQVPGLTPAITKAGSAALKQAWADSLRVIFIIAAPFGVVALVACCFLGDLRKTMNYRVEAPVENLHVKHQHVYNKSHDA
ncbi:hypothetical protein B7463_g8817, partial [Scytalidium lignicola]